MTQRETERHQMAHISEFLRHSLPFGANVALYIPKSNILSVFKYKYCPDIVANPPHTYRQTQTDIRQRKYIVDMFSL